MKVVIFGLAISSSWGNGHATLWRGLCKALAARSHEVTFFERDVPYYAQHRDYVAIPSGTLVLYSDFDAITERAAAELERADVAIVTSFCPDAVSAADLVLEAPHAVHVFYDLDTPVTLAALDSGECPHWVGDRGLEPYDLVLSFTGGIALHLLRAWLGARRVAPLYGFVDPELHCPATGHERFAGSLSYLGTYSPDRQAKVESLFLQSARARPRERFVLGGAQYPEPWKMPGNVVHFPHVAPRDHSAFFCSSRLTLNVTRDTMARFGYCPSGRLFEAAAAGVPLVSDWFEGLESFFEPEREIAVAYGPSDVMRTLKRDPDELAQVSARARKRALSEHTAAHRALELERLLGGAA
jgi:spore maturation protein CgeB